MSSHYVDEDNPARSEIKQLSLNVAIDVAQNRPPWRLMTLLAVHASIDVQFDY